MWALGIWLLLHWLLHVVSLSLRRVRNRLFRMVVLALLGTVETLSDHC
jgi:hypothetical protein